MRQRPLVTQGVITRNGKILSLGRENNLATKVHIVEPTKTEQLPDATSPPGVRMSPSKEWKPYIQPKKNHNGELCDTECFLEPILMFRIIQRKSNKSGKTTAQKSKCKTT